MSKLSIFIFILCILFSFAGVPAFAEEATDAPEVVVTTDPAEAEDTAAAFETEDAVETAEVSETGEAAEEEKILGMETEDSDEIEEAE